MAPSQHGLATPPLPRSASCLSASWLHRAWPHLRAQLTVSVLAASILTDIPQEDPRHPTPEAEATSQVFSHYVASPGLGLGFPGLGLGFPNPNPNPQADLI